MSTQKSNITFHSCQVGVKHNSGYEVKYRGSLIAILEKNDFDHSVHLVSEIEYPFISPLKYWDSLEEAKKEIRFIGQMYDAGIEPIEIARAYEKLGKEQSVKLGEFLLTIEEDLPPQVVDEKT